MNIYVWQKMKNQNENEATYAHLHGNYTKYILREKGDCYGMNINSYVPLQCI